jgi:pimeloyl-ACP methyl ester carboxylesterase
MHLMMRLFGVLSLVVLGVGAYLVWSWFELRDRIADLPPELEPAEQPWRLYLGVALLAWSVLGRSLVLLLLGRKGDDADRLRRAPESLRLIGADGSKLSVEAHGPAEAPALVFVHGWGMDASLWRDARLGLADRFHLVMHDLPGLGRSQGPDGGRYSLDGFADDLRVVVESLGRKRVVLVGHSIGGMTVQTFCARHADLLGAQVVGVVLENTTHHDPTKTTLGASVLQPIKPLLHLAMKLDIALFPLVWLMNWQSYLSGHTHLAMRLSGFGTRPTRAMVEQAARLATLNSPAVQAKGNLAMMRWSVTEDLPRMGVPALVFIGGRDLVTRPRAGEFIAQAMPQASAVRVAEAGHMGPVETAPVYNAAISRFCDDVFTRGARHADAPTGPGAGLQSQSQSNPVEGAVDPYVERQIEGPASETGER